jgi:hypothetical protein
LHRHRTMHIQSTDRAAFKIREFAAKFGHHPTWGYRQVYAGNVAVIDVMGQLMIPTHEVDRLLALAKPYDPKPRKPKLAEETGGGA